MGTESTDNQYLGNDNEVVNLPADTTPADAGWGSDEAVVEIPKSQ